MQPAKARVSAPKARVSAAEARVSRAQACSTAGSRCISGAEARGPPARARAIAAQRCVSAAKSRATAAQRCISAAKARASRSRRWAPAAQATCLRCEGAHLPAVATRSSDERGASTVAVAYDGHEEVRSSARAPRSFAEGGHGCDRDPGPFACAARPVLEGAAAFGPFDPRQGSKGASLRRRDARLDACSSMLGSSVGRLMAQSGPPASEGRTARAERRAPAARAVAHCARSRAAARGVECARGRAELFCARFPLRCAARPRASSGRPTVFDEEGLFS